MTKILYAIQATGNGHLARAKEVLPYLRQHADVDILLSGTQNSINLEHPVNFKLDGLSFSFGKTGGIDWRDTFVKTILPQIKLRVFQELLSIPIHEYDWLMHDFEPISAWRARTSGIPSVQLSHQASFVSKQCPRSLPRSSLTEFIFKNAAPADLNIGLHYQSYDKLITTPIIRSAIRTLEPHDAGHYLVYLPAYSAESIINILSKLPKCEWVVFDRHSTCATQQGNVHIQPISEQAFLEYFESCSGLLTGAGFQATSEAIFLNKKLLVVPQHGQYEQQCNAEALRRLGVPSLHSLHESQLNLIEDWIEYSKPIDLIFPDHTEQLIRWIAAKMEEDASFKAGKSAKLTDLRQTNALPYHLI